MRLFILLFIISSFGCQKQEETTFSTENGFLTLDKIKDLPILDQSSMYYVDEINGQTFAPNMQQIDVAGQETLFIRGWAVDVLAEDLSGGIFIKIDGAIYRAHYRLERTDVAKVFNNKKYDYSGFQCHIPVKALSKGSHTLEILINTKDGAALYLPDKEKRILVKH